MNIKDSPANCINGAIMLKNELIDYARPDRQTSLD